MLAYTYASLFSDRRLRELPGQGRKPEEWECPECYWDSTNDDGMTNAVISVYRGDVYERECTVHWTCPVCGHESDTWEKVIERRRIMKLKYLYAMYDNGEFQGAHTSKEWAEMLHVSVHLVRDYAREGKSYKGRYTFRAIQEDEVWEVNTEIKARDLAEFKRSLKFGARFAYESFRKDFVRGTRVTSEKIFVVRKYPHIVELVSLNDPKRSVTMTYTELLKQRKARIKKH